MKVDLQLFKSLVIYMYILYFSVGSIMGYKTSNEILIRFSFCLTCTGFMDKGTWKKIHQAAATQIYWSTIRRHSTLSYDMLDIYNLAHFTKILGLLRRIHNEGNTLIEEFEINQCDDQLIYSTMNKLKNTFLINILWRSSRTVYKQTYHGIG